MLVVVQKVKRGSEGSEKKAGFILLFIKRFYIFANPEL